MMRFIKLKPIEWEEPSDTPCQSNHEYSDRTVIKSNLYNIHVESDQNNKPKGMLARLGCLFDRNPDPIDDFTQNYLTLIEDPLACSIIHWLGGFDTFGRIAMEANGSGVDVILPMYKSQYDVEYFFSENSAHINRFMNEFSTRVSHLEGKRLFNEYMGYSYEDIDKAARSMLGDDVQYTQVFTDLTRWAVFNAVLSLSVDYAIYHIVN